MNGTIATYWALACLTVAAILVVSSRRIGRNRAAAYLVTLGLFLITIEEAALTIWLALATPDGDPDGMATLVTPMARAHVLDAGVYGVGAAVVLGWIAMTALRRGERWARWVLTAGLVVAALAEVMTTLLIFSRGLPVPGAAGDAGEDAYGWQPLAVALLAWGAGLLVADTSRSPTPSP
jgi:hypothetical protein